MKNRASRVNAEILPLLVYSEVEAVIDKLESKLKKESFNCNLAKILSLSYYLKGNFEQALFVIDRCIGYLKSTKDRKRAKRNEIRDFYLLKILVLDALGEYEEIPELFTKYIGEHLYICPIDLQESLNLDLNLDKIITLEDEGEWLKIKRWLLKTELRDFLNETTIFLQKKFIEILENAINGTSGSTKARAMAILGSLLSEMGRVDIGLNLVRRAIEINPDEEISLILGRIMYLKGNEKEAFEIFREISQRDVSKKYLAYLNMAVILARNNQFEDALKLVNKAIKLNISSVMSWYIRARILFDSERFLDAEKAFRALLSMDPKNTKIYQWLGKTYLALGKIEKAIEFLSKSRVVSGELDELDFLLALAKNYS